MKTRDLTKIAICSSLTIILSWISIPIGLVPITLQILGVFVCAIVLKPTHAMLALVIYILLGVIGIPVFAQGTGGLAVITGATGGFILTFPIIAFFLSYYIDLTSGSKHFQLIIFIKMLVSLVFCYLVGALRFSFYMHLPLDATLGYSVYPFIIPDIIKAVIAAFVLLPALVHTRKAG